jgi:hypothetical protein
MPCGGPRPQPCSRLALPSLLSVLWARSGLPYMALWRNGRASFPKRSRISIRKSGSLAERREDLLLF